MKILHSNYCVLIALFVTILLFSCQSSPPDFKPLSYNELDARIHEVNNIREDIEAEPLKSLWRSMLLIQTLTDFSEEHVALCENVFQESSVASLAVLEQSIVEKNLLQSRILYNSLETISVTEVKKYKESLLALEKEYKNTATTFTVKQSEDLEQLDQSTEINLSSSRISQFLKGLVTVWVDRGVSVQRGLGLPDRVIGSGFFIDTQGHLITNYHVIQSEVDTTYKGYSRVYIKLYDDVETRYPARVVGYDKALDLALLKTESPVPYSFSLGSSEELEVGDKIFAMGSPLGLENTITSGIVSSKNRMLSTIASIMQIDAAVNPGNSGGPIIDANGLVQAIVFAGVQEYEGLNFAIPVEQLQKILLSLFHGEVTHSYSGFYAKTKRDSALQKDVGLEVQYVMRGSSAHKALLDRGDLIQSINGIQIQRVEDFQNVMLSVLPGTIICLSGIKEDESKFEVFVLTEERPEMPLYEAYNREPIEDFFLPSFGMQLKRISMHNKNQFEIESIIKGSIADENGFSIQDPVEIKKIKLLEKNTIIYAELFTRKRNKAYFEVSLAIGSSLDSPYFF